MPIQHETIGRKYTERRIIRQVGDPTEEDIREAQRAWNALREAATLGHKLDTITAVATAQLERSGKPYAPHDLLGPPYTEEWLRENQFRSLDWYAHNLLLSILLWQDRRDRGDHEGAMAQCIALGAMFHEFCTVGSTVQKQSACGAAAKFSEKRQAAREEKASWRKQALPWWAKYPAWSATDVARRIAPRHLQSCRKAIADLKPK